MAEQNRPAAIESVHFIMLPAFRTGFLKRSVVRITANAFYQFTFKRIFNITMKNAALQAADTAF